VPGPKSMCCDVQSQVSIEVCKILRFNRQPPNLSNLMADSDDEALDVSNVLLNEDGDIAEDHGDPFALDDRPLKKRKIKGAKIEHIPTGQDDFDLLSTESLTKSKINGSTFKAMGMFSCSSPTYG